MEEEGWLSERSVNTMGALARWLWTSGETQWQGASRCPSPYIGTERLSIYPSGGKEKNS